MKPNYIEISHTYEQESDSCAPNIAQPQYLKIFTQDAGGGNYLILETERFALNIDEIDAFYTELKEIIKKATPINEE